MKMLKSFFIFYLWVFCVFILFENVIASSEEEEESTESTESPSTLEPEASFGCTPPELKVSRPRRIGTTTAAPFITFGTTQIYLPEDVTTADFEFVGNNNKDLSELNSRKFHHISVDDNIDDDDDEDDEDDDDNNNDHNGGTISRRSHFTNFSPYTWGGESRIKRQASNSYYHHDDDVKYNKVTQTEIDNDKMKRRKKRKTMKMFTSNSRLYKRSLVLPQRNGDNFDERIYIQSTDLISSLQDQKDRMSNDDVSDNNDQIMGEDKVNPFTDAHQSIDKSQETRQKGKFTRNRKSIKFDESLTVNNDQQQQHERVKRKSGKTTGALSRPKADSGSSSAKSTSRKAQAGYDDETGTFVIPHPDGEHPDSSKEDGSHEDSSEQSYFREVSEVRFPGEVGPLGDRRLCKIKCVKGKWMGPLCASNDEDGDGNFKFQPLYKSCHVNRIPPHLLLSYRNISVAVGWDLPHGHSLQARCRDLGMYKLLGESRVLCSNGLWAPRMPSCVPTTLLTNYSDDSPPSIRIKVGVGSGAFEPSGVLAVLPASTIHLDCMYPRRRGTPEWTWTGWFRQYITGWSTVPEEKATKYRLTIKDIQNQDSGTYTCASPRGLTNSIVIVVAVSQCPSVGDTLPPLSLRLEGNKLGQRALYRCPLGYNLEGIANSTCLASGNWSSPPPTCHPVQCPPLYLEEPHLSLVELNTSAWGRAVFKCSWGYRLNGPPGLECEPTGNWSGPLPICKAIQCPQPLVPINGRIDGTSGSNSQRRYAVGALVTFSCTEGHLLVGEASIVCTETGFWSHPPPFCKAQCPYPGDPPNGLIAPLKFHYDPGDYLSVQCRPGFVEYGLHGPPERPRCLPDGNWSGPVPQCRNYEDV